MSDTQTPSKEQDAFEEAVAAMVGLAAAWAKLHNALVKKGEHMGLRP